MVWHLMFYKMRYLVVVLLAGVVIAIAYPKLVSRAYESSEPYNLVLTIEAPRRGEVVLAYDYGGGLLPQHTRKFALELGANTKKLSISAWKPVRSLTLAATKGYEYELTYALVDKGRQNLIDLGAPDLATRSHPVQRVYHLDLKY